MKVEVKEELREADGKEEDNAAAAGAVPGKEQEAGGPVLPTAELTAESAAPATRSRIASRTCSTSQATTDDFVSTSSRVLGYWQPSRRADSSRG